MVTGVETPFSAGEKEPYDYDHLSGPLIAFRLAPDFYICFNLTAKAEL